MICNSNLYRPPIPQGKIRHKPSIVGVYTNDLIYRRFPKEILPTIQVLNPYIILGVRMYKNFQLLTPHGQSLVKEYIQDSIDLMSVCTDWYDFRCKYALKYNLSFQLRLNIPN